MSGENENERDGERDRENERNTQRKSAREVDHCIWLLIINFYFHFISAHMTTESINH